MPTVPVVFLPPITEAITVMPPIIMLHPTTLHTVVVMPPAAVMPPFLVAVMLSATVTPTTATSPIIMTPDWPGPLTQSSTPLALMVPPVSSDWPKHMLDAYQYLTTETKLMKDGTNVFFPFFYYTIICASFTVHFYRLNADNIHQEHSRLS